MESNVKSKLYLLEFSLYNIYIFITHKTISRANCQIIQTPPHCVQKGFSLIIKLFLPGNHVLYQKVDCYNL